MKQVVALSKMSLRVHEAEEANSPDTPELLKQVQAMQAALPTDLDEAMLINRAAAAVPNITGVWWQVVAAVDIEETRAALADATGEEAKQLQTKLDELEAKAPMTGLFSDQWDLMKQVVALSKMSLRVHEAEEANSPDTPELLKQVQAMQAALPTDVDGDALMRRAAAAWILSKAPTHAASQSASSTSTCSQILGLCAPLHNDCCPGLVCDVYSKRCAVDDS